MKTILSKSFSFSRLFALRKYQSKSFIFFFILLMLVSSLPLNYLIIKTKGWDFNPVVNQLEAEFDTFQLPIEIYKEGEEEKILYLSKLTFKKEGIISDGTPYQFSTSTYQFFINQEPSRDELAKGNIIVMTKEDVIFYRKDGSKLVGSYSRIEKPIHFDRIFNEIDAKNEFISIIESVFSGPYIFSSILIWTSANFFMQSVLLFAICGIFMLVRINYQKVATYKEYMRMYVGCLVLPTLVSVGIGLISTATASLTPVILQMGSALMMIGAIYKGSKSEISHPRKLRDQM